MPFRAYFSWLPHQSLDNFFSGLFMHYVAPQGLILHLLTFYAYILFLSPAFHYRATRHGYINHSSSLLLSWCVTLFLCCAWERTLIEHKVLIKTNTEPNQSDIWPVLLFMWQHLQCLFIKSSICSTWTLLVFLFLLLSREKSLTVSQAFRHGSSQFLNRWFIWSLSQSAQSIFLMASD